jgi:hypothetical protein
VRFPSSPVFNQNASSDAKRHRFDSLQFIRSIFVLLFFLEIVRGGGLHLVRSRRNRQAFRTREFAHFVFFVLFSTTFHHHHHHHHHLKEYYYCYYIKEQIEKEKSSVFSLSLCVCVCVSLKGREHEASSREQDQSASESARSYSCG